ncbi:hypothetical protein MMPV_008193 [Pyropia vietnamensis]
MWFGRARVGLAATAAVVTATLLWQRPVLRVGAPPVARDSDARRWPPTAARLERLFMGAPEVALAVAHLFPANRSGERVYLEWGSGGSSIAFAPSADRAYSIEHSTTWCASVSHNLTEARLSPDPVTMVCTPTVFPVPVTIPPPPRAHIAADADGTPDHFDAYVRTVTSLPDRTFTDVLIDGRVRVACALAVLPHLTPTSVVLLHDAERSLYAPIYDWYDTVASTPAGSVPALAVLRAKERARLPGALPVSAATVQGIYDRMRSVHSQGGWVAGASAEIAARVRKGTPVAGALEGVATTAGAAAVRSTEAAPAAATGATTTSGAEVGGGGGGGGGGDVVSGGSPPPPPAHFLNLTNGVEALPALVPAIVPLSSVRYTRLQSSTCEAGDLSRLLTDADAGMLMHAALGGAVYVYDLGSRNAARGVPRSLWYGLPWLAFAANYFWYDVGRRPSQEDAAAAASASSGGSTSNSSRGISNSPCVRDATAGDDDGMAGVPPVWVRGLNVARPWRDACARLDRRVKKRMRYYRPFAHAMGCPRVRLFGVYGRATTMDGQKGAYADLTAACYATAAAAAAAAAASNDGTTRGDEGRTRGEGMPVEVPSLEAPAVAAAATAAATAAAADVSAAGGTPTAAAAAAEEAAMEVRLRAVGLLVYRPGTTGAALVAAAASLPPRPPSPGWPSRPFPAEEGGGGGADNGGGSARIRITQTAGVGWTCGGGDCGERR